MIAELLKSLPFNLSRSLARSALALLGIQCAFATAASAQCNYTEPSVRCTTVQTACAPSQGEAYASCSGGVVTPLSLGPITLYHNSHRSDESSPVVDAGVGLGWSFLPRIEERADGTRVLIGGNGDTALYPKI